MSKDWEMSFDPMTIEHLGVRMYSTLPPVLAELIANAYDADAEEVHVTLKDAGGKKEIAVSDNGTGMSADEINSKFLLIGRNRRGDDGDKKTEKGRKTIGKKGLGKLAFFGIAHEIVVTTKKDGKENAFQMNWEKIKASSSQKQYKPDQLKRGVSCSKDEHGTEFVLRDMQRVTDFDPEAIATSLSKMFIVDPDFKITIVHNGGEPVEVDNNRKYEGLKKEVEWDVPGDIGMQTKYKRHGEIKGKLFATEKPIPPKSSMRGVTLFSRKKLVNRPEYFSDSTSSHFFSYLSGSLEVDFIDDLPEDVIETNRQSLSWDHPEMAELREYLRSLLNWMEQDWRVKRAAVRERKLAEKTGINIPDWFSKLPQDIRAKMEPILQAVVKDSELPEETANAAAEKLHEMIPEYPKYHWRHLHPEIKEIAKDDYINERYFDAVEKASRLYIQRVKERAGVDSGKDDNDIDSAFNVGDGKLMVTSCGDSTERNIQNGQHLLSKGTVIGFRNPLTHNAEYQKKLVDTGLFIEKDCLDALSLISHLFRRLGEAQSRPHVSEGA